ncbi:MAG: hypothetical protein IJ029_07815, partial [Lachnospiraceae bacterium]|nr:hypothetical protein [Lachnospiraceae bacterium]
MRGKEKCKALKEIRRQIAEKNDIEYAVAECTYQGECKGTCPKCEAELRYLERELELRKGLGKAVAVAGISASVCTGLTGCSPAEAVEDFVWESLKKVGVVEETTGVLPQPQVLMGDMEIAEPTEVPTVETELIDGDMPLSEPTETPVPESADESSEIDSEELIAGEVPMLTPLPELLEG